MVYGGHYTALNKLQHFQALWAKGRKMFAIPAPQSSLPLFKPSLIERQYFPQRVGLNAISVRGQATSYIRRSLLYRIPFDGL